MWITQDVQEALSQLDISLEVPAVPEVADLLTQTVLCGGKRFRPALCFLWGRFLGHSLKDLAPYARAAEWVHAATLAHDDVIDESRLRRRRRTLNARASNARAVLAGDLLLSRVMRELATLGHLRLIQELAMTIESLVEGEWLQLEARGHWVDRTHLETVAFKKTASLMVWSSAVGAWLMPDSVAHRQVVLESVKGYAESLGLAFQMVDDVLDYQGGGEKPFAQDLKEGLVNFVTLELGELFPPLKRSLSKLLGQKTPVSYPWTHEELGLACGQVRNRALVKLKKAEIYLQTLFQALPEAQGTSGQALLGLLQQFQSRTL